MKPPRWRDLTVSGTPAPAWRSSISSTALLGMPTTWMLVVASTVSAYAAGCAFGNDPYVKRHRVVVRVDLDNRDSARLAGDVVEGPPGP